MHTQLVIYHIYIYMYERMFVCLYLHMVAKTGLSSLLTLPVPYGNFDKVVHGT